MIKIKMFVYTLVALVLFEAVCVGFDLNFTAYAENEKEQETMEYAVEYSLIGVSAEAFKFAKAGNDYTVKFIPMKEYTMPTTIVVTVGGRIINADEYSYDAQNGSLLVPAEKISADMSISVRGVGVAAEKENRIINIFLYAGMVLCIITGCCSVFLLVTDEKYKGKI